MSAIFGAVHVPCPVCGVEIAVPVHASLGTNADGHPVVGIIPDTSAVWDHFEDVHIEPEEADL